METKINIAELLKDCPKGMELDCTIYNDVTLKSVVCSCYPIQVQTPEGNMALSQYGCMSLSEHAKCVLFPKGKTTWEGFVPPCKFKVGDKIVNDGYVVEITEIDIEGEVYAYESKVGGIGGILFSEQDDWELVPNKFDINTLKPFESRVLVRDYNSEIWRVSFWGCLLDNKEEFKYDTVRGNYKQCIPYEGNEHLLGTTNDCNEYYKNWE